MRFVRADEGGVYMLKNFMKQFVTDSLVCVSPLKITKTSEFEKTFSSLIQFRKTCLSKYDSWKCQIAWIKEFIPNCCHINVRAFVSKSKVSSCTLCPPPPPPPPTPKPNLISNPFISGNVAVYQDALDVWRHHLYTHLSPRCLINYDGTATKTSKKKKKRF